MIAATLLLACVLAAQLATLLPGTGYSGDTAKFQFVGAVLGTPHGPGYPTYVMLNAAWVRLFPFGELAWRVNLLSALFTLGTALYTRAALRLFGAAELVACLGAASVVWTRSLWSQSVVAEVYSLHALYVAALCYHLAAWQLGRGRAHRFAGSGAFALACANHLGIASALPAFAGALWRGASSPGERLRGASWALVLLALSSLQYLYLVERSFDPDTPYLELRALNFERFLWFLSGSKFQDQLFGFSAATWFAERLPELARLAGAELLGLLAFLPLGVRALWQQPQRRGVLGLWAGVALGNLVLASGVDTVDWWVHLVPTWMLAGWLGALGMAQVWVALAERSAWRFLARAAVLAVPLALLTVNGPQVDRSGDRAQAERARAWIETAGRNALIVAPDYNQAEFLWYHLLGLGLGEERNLHVLATRNLRAVRDYVQGRAGIEVPETRRSLAPGLRVLVIGERDRLLLERAGLASRPLGAELHELLPP